MSLGVRALYTAYSVAMELAVWICLAPAMCVRLLVTRAPLADLWQRAGAARPRGRSTRHANGPVLVHAVSVGEMHAVAPLVTALAADGRRIVLTSGTVAGLAAGRRLASVEPAVDAVIWLPWDRRAVRGWLKAMGPSAAVIVETEIWPNLFRACAELSVPLFIVNGRIRPVDVRRYQLVRRLFGHVLQCTSWIGVQSASERDRFIAIGAPAARIEVAGNLKFDAALATEHDPVYVRLDDDLRPLVVAGSTHAPEEGWLLESAHELRAQGRTIRLVLAPRDVARAARVVRLARARGFRVCLSSESSPAPWDVLVLDQYATLRACYARADVVVLGGTFANIGGHNLLEPAALARPIVIGPHTDQITALAQVFVDARAVLCGFGADPARAIVDACKTLLDDPAGARAVGERAAAVCRNGAGSAVRSARAITARLAAIPDSR